MVEEVKVDDDRRAKAEEKKRLGNEAFAKEDIAAAIQHYTEGLELDPENHLLYSNRSACYESKADWEKSAKDAKACIAISQGFLKGYYRLAKAQIELKEYDEAADTIKAGLKIDSESKDLQKLFRIVKAKKSSAAALSKHFDPSQSRLSREELQELQEAFMHTSRQLKDAKMRVQSIKNERRRAELTVAEVQRSAPDIRLYRSLGKMFLMDEKPSILKHLDGQINENDKLEQELTARVEYLEGKHHTQQTTLRANSG